MSFGPAQGPTHVPPIPPSAAPERVLFASESGGQNTYTVLQDAIDTAWAAGASDLTPWVVEFQGRFTESITLRPGITLRGLGLWASIIEGNLTIDCGTGSGSVRYQLSCCQVDAPDGAPAIYLTGGDSCNVYLREVYAVRTSGTAPVLHHDAPATSLRCEACDFEHQDAGEAADIDQGFTLARTCNFDQSGGTSRAVSVAAGAVLIVANGGVTAEQAGESIMVDGTFLSFNAILTAQSGTGWAIEIGATGTAQPCQTTLLVSPGSGIAIQGSGALVLAGVVSVGEEAIDPALTVTVAGHLALAVRATTILRGDLAHEGAGWGMYSAVPQPQPAPIADPAGGGVQDAEARTALSSLLQCFRDRGVVAP